MLETPRNLIEAVAEDIARVLLRRHPLVQAVHVGVYKPHVSVAGHFDNIGVEICRERRDVDNSRQA